MALLSLLVLAQAIGIWVADRCEPAPELARAVALLAIALGLALGSRRRAVCACAALALAAGSAAALATRLALAVRDRPAAPLETTLEGDVVVLARGASDVEVELADAVAVPGEAAHIPPRLLLRAPAGGPLDDALPGDRLRLRARLRPPLPGV